MCDPVTLAIVGSAVLGGGLSVYQGEKQASAAKKANATATEAAAKTATAAEQASNKANAKSPNVAALDNANAAGGGAGSTMLTGPMGIDPSTLTLGKQTLLGAS